MFRSRRSRAIGLATFTSACWLAPFSIAQENVPTVKPDVVPQVDPKPQTPPDTPPAGPEVPSHIPTVPAPPKIDLSKYLNNDKIGYAGLAVEKATIQKSLADEHYLRNDISNADKAYRATLSTLDTEAPDEKLTDSQKSIKKLLRVDVEYRLLNLRLGNDFWSGYRTNKPSTPHRHFLVLEGLLTQLEKQADEVDQLLSVIDSDAAAQARLQGMKIELEGKIKDQSLAQERGVIASRQARSRLDTWEERVKNLTRQRLSAESKSRQLAEEQKQLSAATSSMLVQAVAAGTGVPASVTTAVMTGDLKAALLQEAATQLGNPDSSISKAVGGISENAQKMQDLYSSAYKNYQTLRTTGENLQQVADMVRKPTFDNLVTAGRSLWKVLPEAERVKMTAGVMKSVPTAGMLESYRRLQLTAQDALALKKKIETMSLERIPLADLRGNLNVIAKRIIQNETQAKQQFQQLYRGIANVAISAQQSQVFVEHFLHIGASDIFAGVAPDQRLAVARAMGEDSIEGAINKLASSGLSALPNGRIQNNQILWTVAGKTTTLQIKTLFESAIFADANTGLQDLPAVYDDLIKVAPLRQLAVAQLPSDLLGVSLQSALIKERSLSDRQKSWNSIAAVLSKEATQQASDQLVSQTLGSAVVEDVIKRKEAARFLAVPPTYPVSGGDTGGMSREANEAATAALNYAMPGAGVAFRMAQSFAKMDANVDEMNRLADQSLRIMAEQEQLYDLATEAYFQYALSDVEQRRAEVLRDSADRQLGVYKAEMNRRSTTGAKTLTAVGLRRGLTYYLSERLREEFDLFDRSFAMWNTGLAARGAIAAEIQADPQNIRHALDSDIHLFDWLNRERESTRGDPDMLRVHWRQMLRLAKDVCIKKGCKPGDGALGQIAATGVISAKDELVSAGEWRRFKEWQSNPSGRFSMQFAILPGYKLVPLQYENVRIVDLRMSGKAGGSTSVLNQIALRHSGVSQIPRAAPESEAGIVFQREALLPKQSALFNSASDFDVNALRTRFEGPFTDVNYPSLREFEGYGLYALYELSFENTPQNRKIDDVLIKIAYFYHDASNIISEERYLSSIRSADQSLPFDVYDYRLQSNVSPSCAGQDAPIQAAGATSIPPAMRSSFITAFNRLETPAQPNAFAFLAEPQKKSLQKLQSCLETRVVKVCKPMREIEMIAASWFAAYSAAPIGTRQDVFDPLSPSNDAAVPDDIRQKYRALCSGGRI